MFSIGAIDPKTKTVVSIDLKYGIAAAKIYKFFNDLFDTFNTEEDENECELRKLVTRNSRHLQIWREAGPFLRGMTFVAIDDKGKESQTTVPSLKNWPFTVENIIKLWKKLQQDFGFETLSTRRLNQDPLENFFGQIRGHGGANTNPTPLQFKHSFVTLLLSSISNTTVSGNCEINNDPLLLTLSELYKQNSKACSQTENSQTENSV